MNRRTALRAAVASSLAALGFGAAEAHGIDRSGEVKPIRVYRYRKASVLAAPLVGEWIEVHPRDLRIGDVICFREPHRPRYQLTQPVTFDAEHRVWETVGMTRLDGQPEGAL
jgi:hypothetical protein